MFFGFGLIPCTIIPSIFIQTAHHNQLLAISGGIKDDTIQICCNFYLIKAFIVSCSCRLWLNPKFFIVISPLHLLILQASDKSSKAFQGQFSWKTMKSIQMKKISLQVNIEFSLISNYFKLYNVTVFLNFEWRSAIRTQMGRTKRCTRDAILISIKVNSFLIIQMLPKVSLRSSCYSFDGCCNSPTASIERES